MTNQTPDNQFSSLVNVTGSLFQDKETKSRKPKTLTQQQLKEEFVDHSLDLDLDVNLGKRKRELSNRESEYQAKWRKRLQDRGGMETLLHQSKDFDYKEDLLLQKQEKEIQELKKKIALLEAKKNVEERNKKRNLKERMLRPDAKIKSEYDEEEEPELPPLKDYIDYGLSGILYQNREAFKVYKWEPDHAVRDPSNESQWRIYMIINGDIKETIYLTRNYVFFGNDAQTVDIYTPQNDTEDQHAVLCFRETKRGTVRPFLMDLESKKGTIINGIRLEPARFYELRHGDRIHFVNTSREEFLVIDSNAIPKES